MASAKFRPAISVAIGLEENGACLSLPFRMDECAKATALIWQPVFKSVRGTGRMGGSLGSSTFYGKSNVR